MFCSRGCANSADKKSGYMNREIKARINCKFSLSVKHFSQAATRAISLNQDNILSKTGQRSNANN